MNRSAAAIASALRPARWSAAAKRVARGGAVPGAQLHFGKEIQQRGVARLLLQTGEKLDPGAVEILCGQRFPASGKRIGWTARTGGECQQGWQDKCRAHSDLVNHDV